MPLFNHASVLLMPTVLQDSGAQHAKIRDGGGSFVLVPGVNFGSFVLRDITDAATVVYADTNGLIITGDFAGTGGFRSWLGPWMRDNVAANLVASQMALGATGNPQTGWVMTRAGSVMGISLWASVVGGGAIATIEVFKNGVALCSTTLATSNQTGRSVFAKDLYTFAAGDILDVRITTPAGWTALTSDFAAFIETES